MAGGAPSRDTRASAPQETRTPQASPDASRCADEPGGFVPRIDRNRCEAKADCVRVCPYHVFEIRRLSADKKRGLSFVGRLKTFAHGGKQAFAVNAEACHACGLCVKACPESAIRLVPV